MKKSFILIKYGWTIEIYPRNSRDQVCHQLHRPHPQPEAQRPAHHGDEAQGREGRVEGFCYCHLSVQGQVNC